MIAATAALRCMRANYPRAHIALLLKAYVRPVIAHAPWADEVIEVDPRGGPSGLFATVRRLRRAPPYDLALLLTQSFNSALTARLAGAKRRLGHARDGRRLLLTDAAPWPGRGEKPRLVPKVQVYSSLLEYLGCEGARDQRPEVFTAPEDEAQAEKLLAARGRDAGRPLLAIVPGAAYGASKLWPPARFAAVADALAASRRLQAVLLTGPGEEPIGAEIARAMKDRPIAFREGEVPFGALKAIVRRSEPDDLQRHRAAAPGHRVQYPGRRPHGPDQPGRDAQRLPADDDPAPGPALRALLPPALPDRPSLHDAHHAGDGPQRGRNAA